MNQAEITEAVLERLTTIAGRDPYTWYPDHGWVNDDGSAHGLVPDLFGADPTRSQIDKLGKVLWRLGADEVVEAALFRRKPEVHRMPATPFRQGPTEYSGMSGDSGGIRLDQTNTASA